MKRKGPFSDEIYEPWAAIAFPIAHDVDTRPIDEKVAAWRVLYEATYKGGSWLVSIWDAALIADLGAVLALRSKEYTLAIELSEQFRAHENAAESDEASMVHIIGLQSVALILSGRVGEGVSLLRSLLDSKSGVGMARAVLLGIAEQLPQNQPVSPELTELVGEVIRMVGRFDPPKGNLGSDVREALLQTVPARSTFSPE